MSNLGSQMESHPLNWYPKFERFQIKGQLKIIDLKIMLYLSVLILNSLQNIIWKNYKKNYVRIYLNSDRKIISMS